MVNRGKQDAATKFDAEKQRSMPVCWKLGKLCSPNLLPTKSVLLQKENALKLKINVVEC